MKAVLFGGVAAAFLTAFPAGVHSASSGQSASSDWTAPVTLGGIVNTAAADGCPFISRSGLSLYFASNRAGGLGGFDLWVTQRDSLDDPWEPPQNLGPAVNTAANEICPTVTLDGHWLFFVSDRDGGCGAQDLYLVGRRNKRDDFGWGKRQPEPAKGSRERDIKGKSPWLVRFDEPSSPA